MGVARIASHFCIAIVVVIHTVMGAEVALG